MGNIVKGQDIANYLRLTDDTGAIVTVTEDSDPSSTTLDMIIEGVEGDFNERTHHAWGTLLRVKDETHDLIRAYEWGRGIPIHLAHRSVAEIDFDKGDKLEQWNGTNWVDHTTRKRTTWKQLEGIGKIFILGQTFSIFRDDRIRVTYRYGTEEVPAGIKLAILQKCASKLIETSLAMNNVEFGQDRGLRTTELLDKWDRDYDDAVNRWQDYVRVEY